jgi:branched-subunit amino acid aminotransferase/4-amino-4-deoxychorismate lyase
MAVAAWEWGSYFPLEQRLKGIRLTMAKYRRPDPLTAPARSKAAGLYMICTVEKHRAERAGFADALMLDWRGRIAECTGANIFLIKDGIIHTPDPDCFLDGITRRTVIELAKKRGYQVVEREIMPGELADFSEVFLTGTAAEVTPVSEIDVPLQAGRSPRPCSTTTWLLCSPRAKPPSKSTASFAKRFPAGARPAGVRRRQSGHNGTLVRASCTVVRSFGCHAASTHRHCRRG